ncbi:glutamate--tRNA ligase family protein [Desulfurivibrio sp. C05AmB]|uniref:glutamate--tRNA ligase family protein n=1 Tax=Desulfurivibrio sp. C05AmB TaxID=3374371 RepID=UPI00376EAD2A
MLRSRLAPTPSGYLHLGNAINFVLTWLLVRRAGGVLKLRIDDADAGRCRPEFVTDIFHQLEWLGLDWDEGPSGPDDFAARFSQLQRLEQYRALLAVLAERGLVFACLCSRRRIRETAGPDGLYPGTCRRRRLRPASAHTLRVRVPPSWSANLVAGFPDPDTITVHPGAELGDFIVWRRDNLPAYQLASLGDDLADRINLVVRGRDLLPSTAAQLFLAAQLGPAGQGFCRAEFLHHPLLTDARGGKLSKSDQALSLAAMRQSGIATGAIYRHAAAFIGLESRNIDSLAELQAAFKSAWESNPGRLKPSQSKG